MSQRSWVRIPVPYTGWTFFHIYLLQNLKCLLEKTENKQKEAGVGPFSNNKSCLPILAI